MVIACGLEADDEVLRDNQNPMRCDNQTCQAHWAVCYVGVQRSSRMLAAKIRVKPDLRPPPSAATGLARISAAIPSAIIACVPDCRWIGVSDCRATDRAAERGQGLHEAIIVGFVAQNGEPAAPTMAWSLDQHLVAVLGDVDCYQSGRSGCRMELGHGWSASSVC